MIKDVPRYFFVGVPFLSAGTACKVHAFFDLMGVPAHETRERRFPISPNTSKGSPHFFKRCWMCPEHEGKEIRFFFPIIKPKNTNHLQDSMLREVEEGK